MENLKTDVFWSHVDGTLVINMDDRPDRWETVDATLQQLIPEGKYERFSAVNGRALNGYGERPWFRGRKKDFRWAGRAGCTLSHRKALEAGLKKGWGTFLLLEDDIALREVSDDYLARLGEQLFEKHTDWDMCYLGYTTPRGPAKTVISIDSDSDLCRIRGARTTHAYLIKESLARWLVQKLPDETNVWSWCASKRIIDRWYSRHISFKFKILCTDPSFIIQAPSFSDLVGKQAVDWDNSDMVCDIPTAVKDPSLFWFRWWFSGFCCRIYHSYDMFRGWIKHLKGF